MLHRLVPVTHLLLLVALFRLRRWTHFYHFHFVLLYLKKKKQQQQQNKLKLKVFFAAAVATTLHLIHYILHLHFFFHNNFLFFFRFFAFFANKFQVLFCFRLLLKKCIIWLLYRLNLVLCASFEKLLTQTCPVHI